MGGAGAKWLPQYTEALRGKEIISVPDHEGEGTRRQDRKGARWSRGEVLLSLDDPG